MSVLEAVIVAGGLGTRLLPLTARSPKHLLNVGGVPFLAHQIARLADAGVGHIVVATSYHSDRFAPVLGDGSRWGTSVDYVREEMPLGTGGAIRNVASALTCTAEEPVVILNGDVLSGSDLRAQLADFATLRGGRQPDVSLHLLRVPDARAFGCVPTDASGMVTGFIEKSADPVTDQINAGCYVFRRRVIDDIPSGRVVSVERETFPGLIESGALVVGYVENAYWRDVGTPAALIAASRDVVDGTAPSAAIGSADSGARISSSAVVATSAVVSGGSVVADEVRIEAGAVVTGSVVMRGASLGAGARVVDSAVGPGAVVGAAAGVSACTLGDESTLAPHVVLFDRLVDCAEEVGSEEVGAGEPADAAEH